MVKGGIALELRLGDKARATKDLDLGLRAESLTKQQLQNQIEAALQSDPDNDWFVFEINKLKQLNSNDIGETWRCSVTCFLDSRKFETLKLDIALRTDELTPTENITLSNILSFANIKARRVEVVDLNRHAAEKLHALTTIFKDRLNTRVRDLVDLAILIEHEQIDTAICAQRVQETFRIRNTHPIAETLPELPASWDAQYADLTEGLELKTESYQTALEAVTKLWGDINQILNN